ncbi:hypothetical protein NDU88_003073 [Pleurodeles waltl]|uniref:Uncharacterized protein n=1 Tax=Pleurodeles waltl TaxID=8319 RepID=A0AAV7UXF1_PLEWA|nr:hypothetical protein NDU88_003073 [Pleurodeles waltl]
MALVSALRKQAACQAPGDVLAQMGTDELSLVFNEYSGSDRTRRRRSLTSVRDGEAAECVLTPLLSPRPGLDRGGKFEGQCDWRAVAEVPGGRWWLLMLVVQRRSGQVKKVGLGEGPLKDHI